MSLQNTNTDKPRVLFLMSGSIACYKACNIISALTQKGVLVRCVVTPNALRFIGISTLEGLTGQPVITDLWTGANSFDHLQLPQWAQLALLCPATANTINRLATGAGDDPVSCMYLSWSHNKKPWWIAPAMNTNMLAHPVTQASLKTLATHGTRILPTETGTLACKDTGPGRLLNPDIITAEVLRELDVINKKSA